MSYGGNMATLMKRLEAATSRLEDLVQFAQDNKVNDETASTTTTATTATARPKEVAKEPSASSAGSQERTAAAEQAGPSVPPALVALDPKLDQLVSLSKQIDPILGEQAEEFALGARAVNQLVVLAAQTKKPDMGPKFQEFLQPVSTHMMKISELREKNRASKAANHLATLAEGSVVLSWVTSTKPAPYVKDLKEGAQFYANRILKEHKDDDAHQGWVRAFLSYCNELAAALTADLPNGLNWDPKGMSIDDAIAKQKSGGATKEAGSKTAAAPPPPPPAPTSAQLSENSKAAPSTGSSGSGDMSALFNDLNKGGDITSGLKHVDRKALKDKAPKPPMKPKPKPHSGSPASSSAAPASKFAKEPKMELLDKQWIIENQIDVHDIEIDVSMEQTVMIDNCVGSTIQLKGKANAITINKCAKSGVVVDSVVSEVEVIKSERVKIQIVGTVPSLNLDQSTQLEIYLNEASLSAEIYTSKTSSINLEIPNGEPGDYTEVPLAEQIVHRVAGKKVESTVVPPE